MEQAWTQMNTYASLHAWSFDTYQACLRKPYATCPWCKGDRNNLEQVESKQESIVAKSEPQTPSAGNTSDLQARGNRLPHPFLTSNKINMKI